MASGFLKITSNVDGIRISVDGKHQGVTQNGILNIELESGKRVVTADKANFQRSQYNVAIEEGKVSSLTINLVESSGFSVKKGSDARLAQELGTLTIITDIPGAEIKLNGRLVPETSPLTVEKLGAGEWTIESSVLSHRDIKKVNIMGGQTQVVRVFFLNENEQAYLRELANKNALADKKERDRIYRERLLAEKKKMERLRLQQIEQDRKMAEELKRRIADYEKKVIHKESFSLHYINSKITDGKNFSSYDWADDKIEIFQFVDLEGRKHNVKIAIQFKGSAKYSMLSGVKVTGKQRAVLNLNGRSYKSHEWSFRYHCGSVGGELAKFIRGLNLPQVRLSCRMRSEYDALIEVYPKWTGKRPQ